MPARKNYCMFVILYASNKNAEGWLVRMIINETVTDKGERRSLIIRLLTVVGESYESRTKKKKRRCCLRKLSWSVSQFDILSDIVPGHGQRLLYDEFGPDELRRTQRNPEQH